MSIAIFGVSVPVIVLGPLMIWIFAVTLKWLPATGWGSQPPYVLGVFPSDLGWSYWKKALMPSIALGLGSSAIIARLTRASLLQVIREDYIRTARAKGVKESMVIVRHALKEFHDSGGYNFRPYDCRVGYRNICDRTYVWNSWHGKIFCNQYNQP